jgi:copper(I)-binding protein
MIAGPGSSRRTGAGAMLVIVTVAAAALTGCAAGQRAATIEQSTVIDGVNATVGDIGLRAVTVVAPPSAASYAKGEDAVLQLLIVNSGQQADQLLGVSSPAASSVKLYPTLAGVPTASASASSTSAPAQKFAVGANAQVPIGFAATDKAIVLTGLTAQLYPAQSIPITFQFASAGSVTFKVAVHLAAGPPSTPSMNISPSE